MVSFIDMLVVIGMFLLRFGVPAVAVLGLGYLLKRLDAKWEAEARAERGAEAQPEKQPTLPAERPSVPRRMPAPAPQLPFIIPPRPAKGGLMQVAQPGLAAQPSSAHCWDAKQCSSDKRAACAAPQHPGLPCWQARFDAEGKVPEDCVKCDIFQRYPLM